MPRNKRPSAEGGRGLGERDAWGAGRPTSASAEASPPANVAGREVSISSSSGREIAANSGVKEQDGNSDSGQGPGEIEGRFSTDGDRPQLWWPSSLSPPPGFLATRSTGISPGERAATHRGTDLEKERDNAWRSEKKKQRHCSLRTNSTSQGEENTRAHTAAFVPSESGWVKREPVCLGRRERRWPTRIYERRTGKTRQRLFRAEASRMSGVRRNASEERKEEQMRKRT